METTLNSRFFRVLSISVLTVVTAFSARAYDFMENGLAYNIKEDGASVEVTFERFTQSGYSGLAGDLEIPSSVYHNGVKYSVTSIGERAFFKCQGITSVEMPNTVTSICEYAFTNCTGLVSVSMPNSLLLIGDGAFSYCMNISSLYIPASVTSISADAFLYCGGLSSIAVDGNNALYDSRENCNAIVETATGTIVKGSNSTVIPGTIESIGAFAFLGCSGLESVVIPNSVTRIEKGGFSGCTGLTSLTIGNSVTSIGETAFSHCRGLESVVIPSSVTSIGAGAFYDCGGLSLLVVEDGNSRYDSRAECNAIIETESNTLIAGCKNTAIPGTVTSIGEMSFWGCGGLRSLSIPNSVISVGDNSFYKCSGLTSVIIPNSVVSIGAMAFASCDGLKDLTVGSSVSSIGTNAFSCGSALSIITCKMKEPQNVTYSDPYHIFHYAVDKETCVLRVPTGTLELYRSGMPWSQFSNIVIEGDVNNDDAVTSADVTAIYNIMLGEGGREAPASYDVDGDGEVTTADITAIYNVILGEQ